MKNKVTKSTLGALVVIGVLLSLCACAGTYLPTSMLKKFFLFTVNSEQSARQADPDKLSQNPISLLDDRIFIRMPEGATHPTDYQKKLLYVPEIDRTETKDEVIWAGSNEILRVTAMETFCLVGENWGESQMKDTTSHLRLDEATSILIFETDQEDRYSLAKNCYYILPVHVQMPDNTLIELQFSLYTLGGVERVDFFYDLAKGIAATITPGRTLELNAQTVEWEGLTFETQDGYYVEKPKKKPGFSKKNEGYELIVYKMMPAYKQPKIYMSINNDSKVKEDWGDVALKSDVVLGHEIDWQYISDDFGVRAVGVIPMKNGKSLKVSIVTPNEPIAQELFDIVRTLEKK